MYEKAGFKRIAEFEGWPEGYVNVILCKTLLAGTPDIGLGSKAPFWQSIGHFRSTPMNRHHQSRLACLKRANKRHRATTEGRLLLSFAEQLAGENIDEVHLSDDDKPLD